MAGGRQLQGWDPEETIDLVTRISDYELGELTEEQEVELFQELVTSGIVWHLQGSYQRKALSLLAGNRIDAPGAIVTER